MSYAGRTVLVFGIYLTLVSLIFILHPNGILSLLGVPTTEEAWIRVMGVLMFYLGLYHVAAARGEWAGFIRMSIPVRMSVMIFLAGFVLFANAPAIVLLFSAADFSFALWTWHAMRYSRQ